MNKQYSIFEVNKAFEAHKEILAHNVKDIRAANGLPQSLFDSVEAVIRDYCFYGESDRDKSRGGYRPSIRHGEGVTISEGDKTPISWHFNNDYLEPSEHVTICYKRGREWVDDCYIDELPVDFLLYLLRLIKNRRPLRDTRVDTVYNETAAYVDAKEAEKLERTIEHGLDIMNYLSYLRRSDGDNNEDN